MNKFQIGSVRFVCSSCKRQTRTAGRNDNKHVGICYECSEIEEIKNLIADGNATNDDIVELEALKRQVVKKGGQL